MKLVSVVAGVAVDVRRVMRACLGALVLAVVAGCATVLGELPEAPDEEKGPGTVLLEEQRVRFQLQDGKPVALVTEVRQGHVRGERAQWLRTFGAGYSSSFTDVLDVGIRVRHPDGTRKQYGRDDAVDTPAFPGFVLYSDSRALGLSPPSLPAGSIVEARSTTRHRSAELFSFSWAFGTTLPTATSRFVVEVPEGWEIETYTEEMRERGPVTSSSASPTPATTR